MKKYDTLVFIGRFQPFHKGHQSVVDHALNIANNVIILVGSANRPRSTHNPWTWKERADMIRANYDEKTRKRLWITPLNDVDYNDELWVANVMHTVKSVMITHGGDPNSVALIGLSKDRTSYYLDMFPEWGSVNAKAWVSMEHVVSATDIRYDIFDELGIQGLYPITVGEHVPPPTLNWISNWLQTDSSAKVMYEEFKSERKNKELWAQSPYPVTFVTVDSIVVQNGHILLVKRKGHPGKGTWALPGGFVNVEETLLDSMIRELREETGIKVPEAVLRGSIKDVRVFDAPKRSTRGRTITHAYKIQLKRGPLPKVRGADDAEKAKWVKLTDLKPEEMFEDHYWIIRSMV
jgi:bifunctional NMN adenylyltransferase/nudix hydrolase